MKYDGVKYFKVWWVTWCIITLLSQTFELCQQIDAMSRGLVPNWCSESPPRLPENIINCVLDLVPPRIFFACVTGVFWAFVSSIFWWLIRWSRHRRYVKLLGANETANFSMTLKIEGLVHAIFEAVFFGIPLSAVMLFFADWSTPGSDCPYVVTSESFIYIEAAGILAAFFTACVLAAKASTDSQ